MSLSKVNLVVVGHKDHGKSTLIGRLLYDSKAIPEQKLQDIKQELKESGKAFEFAFLLDSLEEERAGGLSLDIVQTPFRSGKNLYTIIDCPGHKEFIKKMLTGASQADAAVLVVSAKEGVQDQTREHAFLIGTLGIPQLVVAVNKMDEVAFQQARFEEMCEELEKTLAFLGYEKTPMIPISALQGENILTESNEMKWYKGATLIGSLDSTIRPSTLPVSKPLRGLVQDVYQHDGQRVVVCKIQTGILESGRLIGFSPSGEQGLLRVIKSFAAELERAGPGDSVGLLVDGIGGVERGEVLSYPENKPPRIKRFVAKIILFSDFEMKNHDTLTIRYGTAEKKCRVQKILKRIHPTNLTVTTYLPGSLKDGDVGEVEFAALQPLCLEKYSELPELGRFVVEGKRGASAAGVVLRVTPARST